ncbi:MAG TPA: ABC transporter permease [Opitutaceae bacterium]|nr:ABC transporter permease [Opitutaceae bacterium]
MSRLRSWLSRYSTVLALAAMAAALALGTDTFLTASNLLNVLRQISVNLCLSIGMTLVILSGGIDLSVGSVLALAGAVAAGLLKHGFVLPGGAVGAEVTVSGALLAGLLVGGACGGANGLAVTRFGLPPFVATLGMLSIARGLTLLWTGGFPINDLGPGFGFLGTGRVAGVPMPVWISGLLALVFFGVTRRTRWGRRLYAVGGNARAAALSGVNVAGVQLAAYVLAGALSGVAGLLAAARLDSATPSAGAGYELDSIAAVVIGGTSLSGGRGSVPGTVLGCLIIGVLNNGLVLLGVSPFWQQVIKGAVILLAAAFDRRGAEAET